MLILLIIFIIIVIYYTYTYNYKKKYIQKEYKFYKFGREIKKPNSVDIEDIETILRQQNIGKYNDEYDLYGEQNKGIRKGYNQYNNSSLVSDPGDQGECGACWAFASISLLETILAINNGDKFVNELSVQQLFDCTSSLNGETLNFPNRGCNGGDIANVISTLFNKDYKMISNDKYGYVLGDIKLVDYNTRQKVCEEQIKKYIENPVKNSDEDEYDEQNIFNFEPLQVVYIGIERDILKNFIYCYGPIFISCWFCYNIEFINFKDMEAVSSEYIYNKNFTEDETKGHALLLVGWKKINNVLYWYIKNSWGSNWGKEGFFYLEAFKNRIKDMRGVRVLRMDCKKSRGLLSQYSNISINSSDNTLTVKIYFKFFRENVSIPFKFTIRYIGNEYKYIADYQLQDEGFLYDQTNLIISRSTKEDLVNDKSFYYNLENNVLIPAEVNNGNCFFGVISLYGIQRNIEYPYGGEILKWILRIDCGDIYKELIIDWTEAIKI
jgi:C1A family cysteine protease